MAHLTLRSLLTVISLLINLAGCASNVYFFSNYFVFEKNRGYLGKYLGISGGEITIRKFFGCIKMFLSKGNFNPSGNCSTGIDDSGFRANPFSNFVFNKGKMSTA